MIDKNDIILDVKRIYKEKGKITRDIYRKNGQYSEFIIRKLFGDFSSLLKKAGLSRDIQRKNDLIQYFIEFRKIYIRPPSQEEIKTDGYISHLHDFFNGSIESLKNYTEKHHLSQLNKVLTTQDKVFSTKKEYKTSEDIKKYSKYFITSVISHKEVDVNCLKSIKNYCKKNNAKLLLIPCADVASSKRIIDWMFDPVVKNESFVFKTTKLNENLYISDIKVSAKQIKPTTGLSRFGKRNGSTIFAAPKHFLEYTATIDNKFPHALMTTGTICKANYDNDLYMSKRTSFIAQEDHTMGGVIVDLIDDKKFHFRHVKFNQGGDFIDLGVRYYSNGETQNEIVDFVGGDWHSGQTDHNVKYGINDLFLDRLTVRNFIAHDFFNGASINHHEFNIPLKRAISVNKGENSLYDELANGVDDINFLLSIIKGKLVMVKGNHDEFLDRYLADGKYVKDPVNHYHSLEFAKYYLQYFNVIQSAYEYVGGFDFDRVKWLNRDESFKVGDCELGQHGDKGANGSRPSLSNIENSYGKCVIGHAHSAAIMRNVYRVGTFTYKDLGYNVGPSSWTHTGAIVSLQGEVQLINYIPDVGFL